MDEVKKLTRSEAKKAYWATIPKEERIIKSRNLAILKHKNKTPAERREAAMLLVQAKREKRLLNSQ